LSLRLGLRYVAGLREEAGKRIEAERVHAPFATIADVVARCGLRDHEVQTLAHIGAFAVFGLTRRQALWQAAAVPKGPIFERQSMVDSRQSKGQSKHETIDYRPSTIDCSLPPMSPLEGTLADYKGTGITVGPHIMTHLRAPLARDGVSRAADLTHARDGQWTKIAGLVIVRQRPGTAKGFCFITLEDESGTSNAVVVPDMFQRYRAVIHTAALLLIEGPLQKVDGVIHVRARVIRPLSMPQQTLALTGAGYRMRVTPDDEPPHTPPSHDFR
jgi:error-prone DNA polymerase